MKIGIPQIIIIVLWCIGLFMNLEHHGERRTGNYNFFNEIVGILVEALLLYYGGFF